MIQTNMSCRSWIPDSRSIPVWGVGENKNKQDREPTLLNSSLEKIILKMKNPGTFSNSNSFSSISTTHISHKLLLVSYLSCRSLFLNWRKQHYSRVQIRCLRISLIEYSFLRILSILSFLSCIRNQERMKKVRKE